MKVSWIQGMQVSPSPSAVPGFLIQKVTTPLSENFAPPTVMESGGAPMVYVPSSANAVQL
jgi:hypothetical protein